MHCERHRVPIDTEPLRAKNISTAAWNSVEQKCLGRCERVCREVAGKILKRMRLNALCAVFFRGRFYLFRLFATRGTGGM